MIEDNSLLGLACRHVRCGFPFRSEYFPDESFPHGSSLEVIQESVNLVQYYINSTTYHNDSIRNRNQLPHQTHVILDGYNSGERFWKKLKEAVKCGFYLSGCQINSQSSKSEVIACMNGFAIGELVVGPILLPSDTSSLIGIDILTSELFRYPYRQLMSKVPSLDVSVHLRLQFKGFESSSLVNATTYRSEVEDWMLTDQFYTLREAITNKICDVLSTMNIDDNKKSYSVYLAADNAMVKDALFRHIQTSFSRTRDTVCPSLTLPVTVQMLNVSNIAHTSSINQDRSGVQSDTRVKNDELTYSTLFDWYTISSAKTSLNWARYENRYKYFYSTFTETSYFLKKYMSKRAGPDYSLQINRVQAPEWILH